MNDRMLLALPHESQALSLWMHHEDLFHFLVFSAKDPRSIGGYSQRHMMFSLN